MTNGLGQQGIDSAAWHDSTAVGQLLHNDFALVPLNYSPSRRSPRCTKGQRSVIMSLTSVEEHATGSFLSVLLSCVSLISCAVSSDMLFSSSLLHMLGGGGELNHRNQMCLSISPN